MGVHKRTCLLGRGGGPERLTGGVPMRVREKREVRSLTRWATGGLHRGLAAVVAVWCQESPGESQDYLDRVA